MNAPVTNPSLLVAATDLGCLKESAAALPSWDLTERQLCDLELLLTGAFAPLAGYHSRADYESVLRAMRLADGTLWPLPVVLDVSKASRHRSSRGRRSRCAMRRGSCWR